MVFGRTYCGVSRLPIDDGDEVIAVPLGFKIGGDFGSNGKASINNFEWPYYFHSPAERVIYGGNPSQLKLDGKVWDKFQMYMIVRIDVWFGIQNSFHPDTFTTPSSVMLSGGTARKLSKASHNEHMQAIRSTAWSTGAVAEFRHSEWLTQLFRLNWFMCTVGIAPNPMSCVDQFHESGKRYWEVIDKCRANNRPEETEDEDE